MTSFDSIQSDSNDFDGQEAYDAQAELAWEEYDYDEVDQFGDEDFDSYDADGDEFYDVDEAQEWADMYDMDY